MSNLIAPTSDRNRIEFLDVLRGIAILFIFLANIPSFSGLFFMSPEQLAAFPGAELDSWIVNFMKMFVDGKFYSIFSMLFGVGLVIQMRSVERNGLNFNKFFTGRMLALLLIGLVHLYLWYGDILHLYAIVGLLCIPLRKLSNRGLLILAGFLMFMPVFHYLYMILADNYYPYEFFFYADAQLISMGYPSIEIAIPGSPDPIEIIDMYLVLRDADLLELLSVNLLAPFYRWGALLLEGRLFKVMACFLIGVWMGRRIINDQLLADRKFLLRTCVLGFGWGLIFGAISFNPDKLPFGWPADINYSLLYALTVIPMALGIVGLIAILWNSKPGLFKYFKPIGKMALTNYLLQTIISMLFFYGAGFGFIGKFSYWQSHLFVLIVFTLQIIFSTLWLRSFAYGPFEWIWRCMTYWRWIPLKKKAK